jgi:hypothetical protein
MSQLSLNKEEILRSIRLFLENNKRLLQQRSTLIPNGMAQLMSLSYSTYCRSLKRQANLLY